MGCYIRIIINLTQPEKQREKAGSFHLSRGKPLVPFGSQAFQL
jgi:hypothetical protein